MSIRPDVKSLGTIDPEYNRAALATAVREYAVSFAGEVERVASQIERETADDQIRRNVLRWKLNAIAEMRGACYRPEPLSAFIDAWAFTRQLEQFLEHGAGSDLFGPYQSQVQAVTHQLDHQQMAAMRALVAEDEQAIDRLAAPVIDPWVQAHPIEDLSLARQSAIARFAERTVKRNGALQSIGSVEEQVALLSQQARVQLTSLPKMAHWHADLLRQETLDDPKVARMMDDISRVSTGVEQAAAVAATLPALIQGERTIALKAIDTQRQAIVKEIKKERKIVLDTITKVIAQERQLTLDAVTSERLAVLDAIQNEREVALANVDQQRQTTIAWAVGERETVLREVEQQVKIIESMIEKQRTQAVADLERLVDRVLWQVGLAVLSLLVAGAILAPLYARLWPRRGGPS